MIRVRSSGDGCEAPPTKIYKKDPNIEGMICHFPNELIERIIFQHINIRWDKEHPLRLFCPCSLVCRTWKLCTERAAIMNMNLFSRFNFLRSLCKPHYAWIPLPKNPLFHEIIDRRGHEIHVYETKQFSSETFDAIKILEKMPKVKKVCIKSLDDRIWEIAINNCPEIVSIEALDSQLSSNTLDLIAKKLPNLQALKCKTIEFDQLEIVQNLHLLKELVLKKVPEKPTTWAYLGGIFPHLEKLEVYEETLSGDSIIAFISKRESCLKLVLRASKAIKEQCKALEQIFPLVSIEIIEVTPPSCMGGCG